MQKPANRDPHWLMLEVCREFQRGVCTRNEMECKFAHPTRHTQIDNGKVTACFDSLKDRCKRDSCKYFHPPVHLKSQLEINGRYNLYRTKIVGYFQQQQQQASLLQNAFLPVASAANIATAANAFTPFSLQQSLLDSSIQNSQLAGSSSPPSKQSTVRNDKVEVCREFQRQACQRNEDDCKFAHPAQSNLIENFSVQICMDFVKSKCIRENCKYYHPPPSILKQFKSPKAIGAMSPTPSSNSPTSNLTSATSVAAASFASNGLKRPATALDLSQLISNQQYQLPSFKRLCLNSTLGNVSDLSLNYYINPYALVPPVAFSPLQYCAGTQFSFGQHNSLANNALTSGLQTSL